MEKRRVKVKINDLEDKIKETLDALDYSLVNRPEMIERVKKAVVRRLIEIINEETKK